MSSAAPTPGGSAESRSNRAAAPAQARRPRRFLLWGAVVLLVGGLATAWWLRPADLAPPLPADIEDAEVAQAIATAYQAVLDNRRSAAAWGQFGKVLLAQLFDGEADVCFAEAARLDRSDPQWRYGRYVIASKRRPDQAIPLLRQVLEAAESWPAYRSAANLRLGEELLERGALDDAELHFRAEELDNTGGLHAALGLGLVAQARGEDAAAAQYLTRALQSPIARKYAMAQLAVLARGRGDRAAADAYESQLALLPSDSAWPDPFMDEVLDLRVGQRAFERRLRQLEGHKRYAEAAQICLDRLNRNRTAELCTAAGMNLARQRDYDRALPLLREAVQLEADSANAHYSLGLALFARAERAWQTTPEAPAVRDGFREALEHCRRAAQLRTGHGKSYLFWGLSLKYLGQPEEALAPLRMALACQPADAEVQLGLGQALLEAGHADEARTYLENAARLNPNDPRAVQALKRLPHD